MSSIHSLQSKKKTDVNYSVTFAEHSDTEFLWIKFFGDVFPTRIDFEKEFSPKTKPLLMKYLDGKKIHSKYGNLSENWELYKHIPSYRIQENGLSQLGKQIYYISLKYNFLLEVTITYTNTVMLELYFVEKTKVIVDVIRFLKEFNRITQKEKDYISLHLLSMREHVPSLAAIEKRLPLRQINIENLYNDSFEIVHAKILKELAKKNHKGLILLHGDYGTGKSTYIEYLIQKFRKKKFILVPSYIAEKIDSPDLISVFTRYPNSVFIIEEAEKLVRSREQDSSIAGLLNSSSGLLGNLLNSIFILTFNTNESTIDPALLRKGRLILSYKFEKLTVEKAKQLLSLLGKDANIDSPMSVAEIYNLEENQFSKPDTRRIGFE